MSYNGSGVFQINSSGQPVVTGTVISSTAFNALTADLATGLSTAITKDGQTTTTSRILFAQGISSTLVTDATSATTGSIITAGGISTQKALWVGTTSRHVGAATFDAAITYGGVTLSNAVTGTGNMVLSASPTLTGTTLLNAGANTEAARFIGTGAYVGWYNTANSTRIGFIQNAGDAILSITADSGKVLGLGGNGTGSVLTVNGTGLGIGMTPVNVLDITKTQNAASSIKLLNSNGSSGAYSELILSNGTSNANIFQFGTGYGTNSVYRQNGAMLQSDGAGGLTLHAAGANAIYFGQNGNESARFDTSGCLCLGTTTTAGAGNFTIAQSSIAQDINTLYLAGNIKWASGTYGSTGYAAMIYLSNSNGNIATFTYPSGTAGNALGASVAGPYLANAGTAWTNSSDARLKNNFTPLTGVLNAIASINPGQYTWSGKGESPEGKQEIGLRAQEVYAQFPNTVDKPDTDDGKGDWQEGVSKKWGFNESKMGVIAIAGVKELHAIVQDLTTRLAALENKT